MKNQHIVLIGAGVMGEALGVGIAERLRPAPTMIVVEPNAERGASVAERLSATHSPLAEALSKPSLVLLAVKPQHVDDVLSEIASVIQPGSTIVSIAAGVRTERIERAVPGVNVVRAMPNTPARIQAGVIGLCAGPNCSTQAAERAAEVLRCAGVVVQVAEVQMDALTAVSGSGPAYVFYLAEAMLAAAKDLDLPEAVSRSLVIETIAGAAALMAASEESPTELRANVTSPGGTTQAAIESLEAAQVAQHVRDAIKAARDRSRELS